MIENQQQENVLIYLPYCQTERQKEILQAIASHGSKSSAAKALNLNRRNVDRALERIKRNASRRGISTQWGLNTEAPSSQFLKGASILTHNDRGELTWLKFWNDDFKQDKLRELVSFLSDEIPSLPSIPAPKHIESTDLMVQYVITDLHLAMLSWPEETGEQYDIDIAVDLLEKWFGLALQENVSSDQCVLVFLGDIFHFDGFFAVTPKNHNLLDVDSRFPRMYELGIRAFKRITSWLLAKHNHVHLVFIPGNHDTSTLVTTKVLMESLYENEPRITINQSHDPFQAYQFGNVSLFYTHGDSRGATKELKLSSIFASKYRSIWGSTTYSEAHVGHLHQRMVVDTGMMHVYRHATMAARDAWSNKEGYISDRGAEVATYHKTYGRIKTIYYTPNRVQNFVVLNSA